MNNKFSVLVNLLWRECILNLNKVLSDKDANRFSNNDYYYLIIIDSMGKPNFSEIAEVLGVTKPAVSAIVRKLSDMELIFKSQSEKDKRVFYVELTEKGKNILNGDMEVYKWVVDNIYDITENEEEIRIMERVINELVIRLEKKDK